MQLPMMDPDVISVVIGGDFCPDGNVEVAFRSGRLTAHDMVGSLRPLFAGADIGIVNLESPLTVRGSAIRKTGPNIRAHPETIQLLNGLGVTVAALANNHIRDYGESGVVDTLKVSVEAGIETVGAGDGIEAARNIHYRSVKSRRVAIINATEREFSIASVRRAGANPFDLIQMINDVREARSQADHVIIVLHGGLEHTHYPSPESVRVLRFIAEQGVTAVLRHHAHAVQGWEVWKGVPIFYGLGNLFYNSGNLLRPGWFEGLVAELHISASNACTVAVHAISQCAGALKMVPMEGPVRMAFDERLRGYSAALQDPAVLAREWANELVRRRTAYYGQLILPGKGLLARVARRLGVLDQIRLSKDRELFFANMLGCDTHREVMRAMLEVPDEID